MNVVVRRHAKDGDSLTVTSMQYRLRTLRGQFTLRNLFVAMFWSALWCWSLLADFKGRSSDVVMNCIMLFRIIGRLIAIDALYGHNRDGHDRKDCP